MTAGRGGGAHARRAASARWTWTTVSLVGVVALVGGVAVWVADSEGTASEPVIVVRPTRAASVSSAIDARAVTRSVPADAVVNVKSAFGAVGDGRTDDTAAVQAAVSAVIGQDNFRGVLFFPAGTYLLRKSIEWRRADGTWAASGTLAGENRDRTVLKLADGSPGFSDPAQPRAVVVTGSQNAIGPDGSGNQAFGNFVFDLTVDVGKKNPGADGIDYLANNRGAIRNVVVRAARGSGHTGISMTRRWPGPALLEDIRVDGFESGIVTSRSEYSMTVEDLRLSGQRVVGVLNQGNVLCIRRLKSKNKVTAVASKGGYPPGLLTMIDSIMEGGNRNYPAVDNEGGAFLRGNSFAGYAALVRNRGVTQKVPANGEWSSDPPEVLLGGRPKSLALPVAENPDVPTVPIGQMAGVDAAGARGNDSLDDTAAIQAALNSGKPVVYLRAGRYRVSRTLIVPRSVRAIVGFEGQIEATGGDFAGSSNAPVFSVRDSSSDPLILAQLGFRAPLSVVDVERIADRPIAMTDIHIGGLPFRGSPGSIYLSDVEGGQGWRFDAGQQVWARHLNAEQSHTKITNQGAQLWILGLKTESIGTAVHSAAGARTELLGALLYPVGVVPDDTPAFSAEDSTQSLVFATSAITEDRNYRVLVDARRGPAAGKLLPADALRRGSASLVPAYSDVP